MTLDNADICTMVIRPACQIGAVMNKDTVEIYLTGEIGLVYVNSTWAELIIFNAFLTEEG